MMIYILELFDSEGERNYVHYFSSEELARKQVHKIATECEIKCEDIDFEITSIKLD